MQLVDVFVTKPLRRKFTNSLDYFVKSNCYTMEQHMAQQEETTRRVLRKASMAISPTEEDIEEVHEPLTDNMSISFEKFDRAYSQFCFKEGLKHQQDSETIRKYMILKCNARVLVKQVDVVTGVRWIDESVSETNGEESCVGGIHGIP